MSFAVGCAFSTAGVKFQRRGCSYLRLTRPSFEQQCVGGRRRGGRRGRVAARAFRPVIATSEYWYDDEEEFDALTDAMTPKTLVLVAAPAAGDAPAAAAVDALRALLQPLKLDQAFSSQEALPFAQQLWAGRDTAPYFLKVRARPQLDAAAAAGGSGATAAAAAAAAEAVWQELLEQNWRVELDAGLGAEVPEAETLLLVAAPQAVGRLLAAAGAQPDAAPAAGAVCVVEVEGTRAGDPLDWRALAKRLALANAQPGSGSADIAAALRGASASEAAAK